MQKNRGKTKHKSDVQVLIDSKWRGGCVCVCLCDGSQTLEIMHQRGEMNGVKPLYQISSVNDLYSAAFTFAIGR